MTTQPRFVRALLAAGLTAALAAAPVAPALAAETSAAEATPMIQLPDFRQLVKQNSAAVVNIRTRSETKPGEVFRAPEMPEFPEGSPFNEFFKRFFEGPGGATPSPRTQRGQGSGFIISSDGYVLTNAHVVKSADEIIVRLNDRREQAAKLVGLDERTDVALLKIDAQNLPTVRIGDSDSLEVGEWVLAIGSPFGLEYTATQGIVSALGRNLPSDAYVPFIQSDVAVNPGNSGGPLFNTQGEVVGINSQIFSGTGGYMGVSFAIPIDTAMRVADQLKTDGQVTRGWLGVVIQNLDRELAQSFGLDRAQGALVSKVMPGSPADKAGLEVGDVIVSYDGQDLDRSQQLPYLVGTTAVGKQVPLIVLRDGETLDLRVTIDKLNGQNRQLAMGGGGSGLDEDARLNLSVADLNKAQRQELELADRGVLVRNVGQGPAREAGIRPGDVILSLNRKDVKSVAQLSALVKSLPKGKSVPVLVQRDKGSLFLALRLPS